MRTGSRPRIWSPHQNGSRPRIWSPRIWSPPYLEPWSPREVWNFVKLGADLEPRFQVSKVSIRGEQTISLKKAKDHLEVQIGGNKKRGRDPFWGTRNGDAIRCDLFCIICYTVPMPRQPRNAPGGLVYHVLNRANGRRQLFYRDDDYIAFLKVLSQALARR